MMCEIFKGIYGFIILIAKDQKQAKFGHHWEKKKKKQGKNNQSTV